MKLKGVQTNEKLMLSYSRVNRDGTNPNYERTMMNPTNKYQAYT